MISEDKWSAFGHYVIGADNTPLFHPRIAMEQELTTRRRARFVFHDKVFEAANPKKEPSESLLDLYQTRLQQLRTKYDYLVLMYSGGADSHNILKCSEYFDQPLDEIVSFVDSSYKNKNSKISAEIYQVAVPEVMGYLERFPDAEYRLIEVRDVQTKLFNDPQFQFDMYRDMGYHLVPFSIMHFYGLYYVQKYRDLHAQGKKVCIIHGVDKPRLRCLDGRWSFNFSDWSSFFGHKHYFRDLPFYDELFYWTPDLPTLSIKQAHVATRYLDGLDVTSIDTSYRNNQLPNVVTMKNGTRINWELFNHIIYPFWIKGTFSTGKTFESYISNGRDDTLTNSNDSIISSYRHSVKKALALARHTGHLLTAAGINAATESRKGIGIAPMSSMTHFIE